MDEDGFRYPTPEKVMEGRLQRIEERRQRRAALGQEGRDAEDREQKAAIRKRWIAGIDLVAMALENPDELNEPRRLALLGRAVYWPDGTAFLQALPGYLESRCGAYLKFQAAAGSPTGRVAHLSPELCKFTLCDWRLPPSWKRGGDATAALEDMYQEQLQLEQDGADLEKAREVARSDGNKAARHHASAKLRAFEVMREGGAALSADKLWENLQPQAPAWLQNIRENYERYGFFLYKSAGLAERETAWSRWATVFQDDQDTYRGDWMGYRVAEDTIREGAILLENMHLEWVESLDVSAATEKAIRQYTPLVVRRDGIEITNMVSTLDFQNRQSNAPKSMILENVFLAITDDCIFPALDDHDIYHGNPDLNYAPKLALGELPTFFVWAYDAHWQPPPSKEMKDLSLVHKGGAGQDAPSSQTAENDGYRGTVKVDITVLFSWFYHAIVSEGLSIKEIWQEAQRMEDQTWTARRSPINGYMRKALS